LVASAIYGITDLVGSGAVGIVGAESGFLCRERMGFLFQIRFRDTLERRRTKAQQIGIVRAHGMPFWIAKSRICAIPAGELQSPPGNCCRACRSARCCRQPKPPCAPMPTPPKWCDASRRDAPGGWLLNMRKGNPSTVFFTAILIGLAIWAMVGPPPSHTKPVIKLRFAGTSRH